MSYYLNVIWHRCWYQTISFYPPSLHFLLTSTSSLPPLSLLPFLIPSHLSHPLLPPSPSFPHPLSFSLPPPPLLSSPFPPTPLSLKDGTKRRHILLPACYSTLILNLRQFSTCISGRQGLWYKPSKLCPHTAVS